LPATAAAYTNQVTAHVYLAAVMRQPAFYAVPLNGPFHFVTTIANAGDERLFVGQKDGLIWVRQASGMATPFLDLRSRVNSNGTELGLFDLVFDPEYAQNGFFYVSFSGEYQGSSRNVLVSRFQVTADPNLADPNSEVLLVRVEKIRVIHNGGGMAFNSLDGRLYIGIGDDLQFQVAQDIRSPKGKILSLDVSQVTDGSTAPDVDVHIMGLRNPWRFDIDPLTGEIYIGDVGEHLWEEVNLASYLWESPNYGWPCVEGEEIRSDSGECENPATFLLPHFAYEHENGRCSITGGEVYRPATAPNDGRFIFGDYCTGEVWALGRVNGDWQTTFLGQLPALGLTTFGVDHQGNLYAGSAGASVALYRIYLDSVGSK
jgi:glucose/arabinose dehydrogenase